MKKLKKGGAKLKDLQISLAAARVNAEMTQADVAKAMKVSTNIIIDIEAGRREIRPAELSYLARLYKVDEDNLRLPIVTT